jgi:hypothetical protein
VGGTLITGELKPLYTLYTTHKIVPYVTIQGPYSLHKIEIKKRSEIKLELSEVRLKQQI